MIWLRKTRIAQVVLMISVSTLFVTGIAVAASGQFNPIAEEIEAAVDSGELTREEADAKRLEMRKRLAEGGQGFEKKGDWDRVSPEDIKERIRAIEAAVDSGELTREEADARRLEMRKRLAEFERIYSAGDQLLAAPAR